MSKSHPSGQSVSPNQLDRAHDFNFDLWARQVKRQMIAALRRRGAM